MSNFVFFLTAFRHSSVVRALESFETMITSFSTHSVSSTLCSFDLTRRSASDLWSSCLDVRRRFDDTDTDTDTDTNSDSVFDKLQPIDFTFREVELNGESIITSSESTKLLLQSFMVEAGKEKTRALNRLRRFGPTG